MSGPSPPPGWPVVGTFVPAGSLAFSGFGAAAMMFKSSAGVALAAPASAPWIGTSGGSLICGGIIQLAGGHYGVTGVGYPFGLGDYNVAALDSQLATVLGGTASATATASLAHNYVDTFYALRIKTVATNSTMELCKFDATGALLTTFTMSATQTSPFVGAIGVDPSETVCYHVKRTVDTVSKQTLGGSDAAFVTETGFKVLDNAILVLANGEVLIGWSKSSTTGYVKHYSAAGALLHTYALTGTNPSPVCLTPGLTSATVFLSYYTTSAATFSTIRVVEIELVTGTILNSFDPNDGTFQYDGPFCVVRLDIGTNPTPPPAPPITPNTLCVPSSTNVTSPAKNLAGCNVGGVGWVAQYTLDSGLVTVGADADPGELLTGKPGAEVWIDVYHTNFETDALEVLRYAHVDLDDLDYGGRKIGRLNTLGEVVHEWSDANGNVSAGEVQVEIADTDGQPIGLALADAGRRYFTGDDLVVLARSDAGRRLGVRPRVLMRGLIQAHSYASARKASFTALDPIFSDVGLSDPDKKWPLWLFPESVYAGIAPNDLFTKPMPVIFGEKSDHGATDPLTHAPAERGLCPLTYEGLDGIATGPGGSAEVWGRWNVCLLACYKVFQLFGSDLGGGLYGSGNATSDGATPSVFTLGGSPDLSGVPVDGSIPFLVETAAGWQTAAITAIDNTAKTVTVDSTIAAADATSRDWVIGREQHDRVEIDIASRQGIDVMVPGYPGYVRSAPYEDIMGSDGEVYRETVVWIRGPLLDDALNGRVSLTANVGGVEDQGDGSGLLITKYFEAFMLFLDNFVHRNGKGPTGGGGLWPQTDSELPAFRDGTYRTRHSTFRKAQAYREAQFGRFEISAYFGPQVSLRDALQQFCDNGGCRLGEDEDGSIAVVLIDQAIEESPGWPRIDAVNRVFGAVRWWTETTEIENHVSGQCDWDPDQEIYRSALIEVNSPEGLAHTQSVKKSSKFIDGKLLRDSTVFRQLLQRRLYQQEDGFDYVELADGDIGLVDYPIGGGILYTDEDGPGDGGYDDAPLLILGRKVALETQLVTLTCLDLTNLMAKILSKTVTLTDAQIKALPTTPITVVAAPGVGFSIEPLYAVVFCKAASGAYTNIDAGANLTLRFAAVATMGFLPNDASIVVGSKTRVTDLLGSTTPRSARFSPYMDGDDVDQWGDIPQNVQTSLVTNDALKLTLDNGGSGNLTGGHATSTVTVVCTYQIVAVP